jgi:putative endonuclease
MAFMPATDRTPGADGRVRLGRRGELLAAAHLRGLGFDILSRNHQTRYGEIDLIAFDGDTLVFAEVKTRRARVAIAAGGAAMPGAAPRGASWPEAGPDPALGWPAARQRRRLRRLALAWLADRGRQRPRAREIRFDLVRVLVDDRERLRAIEHVPGAL